MVKEDVIAAIRSKERRNMMIIIGLLIVTVVVAVISLAVSEVKIGFGEAFRIFVDAVQGKTPADFDTFLKTRIVYYENGPRAIGAICAGAVLSISGAVLQNVIRNPLADPYTLGISSGALFGMVICLIFGISIIPFVSVSNAIIVNAFVCALIPTTIVIIISVFKKVTPTMMILCGIAVMYVFTAITTLMKFTAEPETYSQIYTWAIGSVSGLSWGSIPKMIVALLITYIPLQIWHRKLDIVSQGDNNAISLGVNPNRMRIASLICVSLGTAIIVCYTGTIGFVGLISPHICRIFMGSDCKYLIPCSAVVGGLTVLASDIIVRLLAPALPVGVIIALVSSPIFIYILVRMKKSYW